MIGKNVLTGRWITIVDNAHGDFNSAMINIAPIHRPLYIKGEVQIDDNVWIGDKVTIVSGVKIGQNSIIGANSVVTKNIPANCIAGGNPAKIIKVIH